MQSDSDGFGTPTVGTVLEKTVNQTMDDEARMSDMFAVLCRGTSDEVGKGSTTDDEVCVNCLHRFQLIVCISSVYLRDAER